LFSEEAFGDRLVSVLGAMDKEMHSGTLQNFYSKQNGDKLKDE
jgi:hypothetical protein